MILPLLEFASQLAVERLLKSLPAGLLVALFAWAILRVLPRQNSRTRFAVWFFALLAIASLPWLGNLTSTQPAAIGASSGATGVLARLPTMPAAISLPAHWAPAILLLWSLISLVILSRIVVGLWNLLELRKQCAKLDPADLDPTLGHLIAELNGSRTVFARSVAVATSDQVCVPTALGLWSPMVVLPTWTLGELPQQDLAIVLRHEFAHLQRWDDWTNLVQKIVRALFFFHPAVWWIEGRLSVEREMACDDVVVAQTDNPTGYASCLISLLERNLPRRGWTMAQALVHRAREVSERLTRILDKNRPSATRTSKSALGLIGAFAALLIVLLPYTPQVVAFEETPQPTMVASNSVVATPAILQTSFTKSLIHPAMFTERVSSVRRVTRNALKDHAAPQHDGTNAGTLAYSHNQVQQGLSQIASGRTAQGRVSGGHSSAAYGTVDTGIVQAPQGRAMLAQDVSPGSATEDGQSPVGTAQSPAPTFVNLSDTAQPTLVFVNATQEFDPISGTVIWRVQVWRVTLMNPVWKHVASAAHST